MKLSSLLIVTLTIVACGPGEQGPAGPVGIQGPKGDSGSSGIGLTGQTICFGTSLFGTTAATAYHIRYDFADGSAFVDCSIFPSNANGQEKEATFPIFYKSTDAENQTGDCPVSHDVDAIAGSGVFEFRVNKGSPEGRATYRDSNSGYDGTIIALDCTSR